VTRLALVATFGLILIAVQGSDRETLLSPGPLTFQHSVVGGCAGCHAGFADGPVGWVRAAFGLAEAAHTDRACQSCHDLGHDAVLAHSRPVAETAALTASARERWPQNATPSPELALSAWLFGHADHAVPNVGCATCHREHSGVEADLTAMPDGACQTCHVVQFASFGRGHPAFGATLFDRRPRIAFDHASHLDRHFAAQGSAGKAPSTCTSCHAPDNSGRFMATRSFETMCGACHADDIAGVSLTGRKGLTFLAVPGLDTRELEARGVDIGDWPKWSEEPLTPFMRRMLQRDSGIAEALRRFDALDPLDLREAGPDDIRAVAEVAIAVKRLVGDLLTGGFAAAERRLAPAEGPPEGPVAAVAGGTGALLGHMPMEVLQVAARDWFPRLADDLAGSLPRLPTTIPGPASDDGGAATAAPPIAQSDILAPSAGGSAPALDQSDILAPSAGGSAPALDQSDILAPSAGGSAPALDQSDILAPSAGGSAPALDQSDILAPSAGGSAPALDRSDILAPSAGGSAPALDRSDILAPSAGGSAPALDQSDILAPVPQTSPTPPVEVQESPPAAPAVLAPEVGPEEWMAAGGWYRLDSALLYRPTGHADEFLRAWLDVAVAAAVPPGGDAPGKGLMAVLGSPRAPGDCLQCHSVDRDRSGAGTVNWLPARHDPTRRDFVRFSHAPHFSLLGQSGCQTCHAVVRQAAGTPSSAFQDQYRQGDPLSAVVVDFSAPKVATCAECHTSERAGDACTLCHAYHVGRFETPTVPTRMQVFAPGTR